MSELKVLPREIELLQKAAKFLAECQDLDEIKKIHDQAEALRLYHAKQRDGEAAENAAGKIKLRAARRIGEISRELEKSNPGSPKKDLSKTSLPKSKTLAEAGLSRVVANNCEAIAAVPEKEFEEALGTTAKITSNAMQKKGRTYKRKAKKKAALDGTSSNGKVSNLSCKIIHGDCTSIFHDIEPESARLVFADPPYNIGIDYGDHFSDSRTDDNYITWTDMWMGGAASRLISDGSLWILINWEYMPDVVRIGQNMGLFLRQTLIWYESFGVNTTRMFNRCSRALLWFTLSERRFVFNDNVEVGNPGSIRRKSDRQEKYSDKRADPDGKLWDDVWGINPAIPRLMGTCSERLPDFPTQLPLALLRPIIACASDPGDLVIDPFCGSGTTGVACIELGRRFIGIELGTEFSVMAEKRLIQAGAKH